MNTIEQNIGRIHKNLDKIYSHYNLPRPEKMARLIAVSKKQPDDRIEGALAAGHRLYGENRVQEAMERWSSRKAEYPELELHLIGPLQSNKAADAVALFDVIQTLDREKLVAALARAEADQGVKRQYFIQVNTGNEPQKSGITVDAMPDLLALAGEAGLDIKGLMCIPPQGEPPAPHFILLKKLADRHDLPECSMGMSGDYEKAALCGATYIRVGSSIFGEREENTKLTGKKSVEDQASLSMPAVRGSSAKE